MLARFLDRTPVNADLGLLILRIGGGLSMVMFVC